jgi:signal transduction histidine kinase
VNSDTVALIAIATGWAGAVGVVSLVVARVSRRRSLRWAFALVAVSGVAALVAAFVGTAQAMFLSSHDFGVVLWVSGVAGFVSLVFAFLVSRYAVRASEELQDATRELGDTGRFVPPSDLPAELTAVSVQLDDAASRLAGSRERERTLEASRRELVAWVSHDLRTPLAGLRAMAEALEDGFVEDPSRYYRQMGQTVDRMTRMVDDLFELSCIHAGTLQLSLEAVSLDEAISEAIAVSAPVAQARGVRLDGHADPGVAVRADPRELSRMIMNLVTNAIRHTPTEGLVEVTGRAGAQGIELSVSDACGGIPEGDLGRVFDVAWRGNDARTPGADSGSGLGLAIVRGIAEAHRGSVQVDNVGAGCRFLIVLPT